MSLELLKFDNVFYIDEARKAHWLRLLDDAREVGAVATFNSVYETDAVVIPFPCKIEQEPNGAA